jgi:hypothetical protein
LRIDRDLRIVDPMNRHNRHREDAGGLGIGFERHNPGRIGIEARDVPVQPILIVRAAIHRIAVRKRAAATGNSGDVAKIESAILMWPMRTRCSNPITPRLLARLRFWTSLRAVAG